MNSGNPRMGCPGWQSHPREPRPKLPSNGHGIVPLQHHSNPGLGAIGNSISNAPFYQSSHSLPFSYEASPTKCTACYALGAELENVQINLNVISRKYTALSLEHDSCSKIITSLENELEDHRNCMTIIFKQGRDIQVEREQNAILEEEVKALKKQLMNAEELLDIAVTSKALDEFHSKRQTRDNPEGINTSCKHSSVVPPGYQTVPGRTQVMREMPTVLRRVVEEVHQDVFEMPLDYALAHCVGSDLIMSSGIAVRFRKEFRSVEQLLDQHQDAGGVAHLLISDRRVFYLVTKEQSPGMPTWEDFEKSVKELRKLCIDLDVKKLAIPKLGCGRDRLDWKAVKRCLNTEFSALDIEIKACLIQDEKPRDLKWSLKLVQNPISMRDLNPLCCALLFIASKDGVKTKQIGNLDSKYDFYSHYSAYTTKSFEHNGLYHYQKPGINIFGLNAKEKYNERLSFVNLSECFKSLRKAMKYEGLEFIGIEAFDEKGCHLVTRKLWTVLVDVMYTEAFEVHICWPYYVKEEPWTD